ncbi:Family with sequence similarity 117, member [Nesidiocoris tenuis]|uniref:Family with sequence similarity 117, member n=1 Tax=Nesidiocoris tenuis TaxID=355587 RepID=A0ABN7BGC5_9HEMI|nr:Family with sequence similarity 117, member [Nesidiocoris tenuis]
MSSSPWIRKSPCSRLQGPLKATLPVSSLTRQISSRDSPSSAASSPWKVSISPDSVLSGIRSPGSVNHKGKCRTLHNSEFASACMRRTASLDTIYLTGHWPRESLGLQVDRSTQTEEWLTEGRKRLESSNEDKLDKFIRHRMQRSKEMQRGPAFPLSGGLGSPDSHTQRHRIRSSIEGLNQEIERLVLRGTGQASCSSFQDVQDAKGCVESTPEGHRAPVADLLRQNTRSVNTQTPAYADASAQSSGPPSVFSGSPAGSRSSSRAADSRPPSDLHGGISEDSSPEAEGKQLGTSPRINRFLAREPPDGCERVSMKFQEENRKPMVDLSQMDYPLKPASGNFELKPSLGSAFQPLRSTQ